ncbi:MAG: Tol-Pal system protein TolB [Alphaproteobacteria bacterium]|nr:Tol-Pal system protein TolB [Alphaproteobacteria bacterium]
MKNIFRAALAAVAFSALTIALPPVAQAELVIDITKPSMEPLPIAIADFGAASPGETGVSGEISQVIRNDLQNSGLFRSLDPNSFITRSPDVAAPPKFADWRVINSQALVTGKTYLESDGRLRVEFRLWDIFAEQQMIGFQFFTSPENSRRVGHMIADAVYERLTGDKGYFDTRVVYVAESGPVTRRTKRLAIMDQDGANASFLTDGRNLVLTPRFSPTNQAISFMSYQGERPRVYIFDLNSGREEVLQGFNGMTFAPRFSPDGNSLVMSMARDGNTDLYLVDLRTRATRRLTSDPSIDTGGSFSPDGSQIVFESDRGGTQQIYVMNADGSNPHRISFGDGRYATPVWSPRGDMIAFTKMLGGTFGIGVMRTNGQGERRLTESFLDEGPSWAPNGRVIMFTRGAPGGNSSIYSVDLTGRNLRRIPTPGAASDPAWSPDLDTSSATN